MEFDQPIKTKIQGLTWTPKRVVRDDRGAVFLMLKDGQFEFPVGEIYFSQVNPDVIKGWKLHSQMLQRFAVPVGAVKFVFVDLRENSSTFGAIEEMISGESRYGLISVPSGVWYSFKGMAATPSLIINAASMPRVEGEASLIDMPHFKHFKWQ